jgi:hypothetical protein
MTQSDGACKAPFHYRAQLPAGIRLATALVVVFALLPLYFLATHAGTPSYVASPAVTVATILVSNVLLSQKVVLTGEGGLTVTGLGRRIEVDVRRITAISVSASARGGFGFGHVHGNGGKFRIWHTMTYLPDPRRRLRRYYTFGSVSEDFRDLVYRLYLINPGMTVRGIDPPAWARPPAMHQSPSAY